MLDPSRRVPYLVTLCVSVAFVALGAYSAWPSPVLLKFTRNETNVDIDQYGVSWMLSVSPIGFIMGSLITRYTADRLGRRAAILSGAPPLALGTIIAAFALKGWLLCITTFMWSCGTGMITAVIGIYIAEISDKDIRASLSLFTRFAFNLGNLMMMALGPILPYQTLNYLLLPLPFVYFGLCWWIPETPYFLLKEGRKEEAKMVLDKLRSYKEEKVGVEELMKIQEGVKQQMANSSSAYELFTGKQYRTAVIVSAGLKITQIMTGGTTIKQYLGVIMKESQLDKKYEHTVFLSFGLITSVVAMMSTILVERMGRRPLLIGSYLGTAISLVLVGIYFFFLDVIQIDHASLAPYGVVPFVGIILSNVISTFGFIALNMVIPAEIFPINVKAVAMTSLNVFGGVLAFIVGKSYQHFKDWFGQCALFWIFAAIAFFGAVFTYFIVPETRGKGLNDIQNELHEKDAKENGLLNEVNVDKHDRGDGVELTELEELSTREFSKTD